MEIWRTIPDWPRYQVSSMGRVAGKVWRLTGGGAIREKVLKRKILKLKRHNGRRGKFYYRVDFSRTKSFLVHRLVLLAFIGDPPDDERIEAGHLNDDGMDNRLENLKWMSRTENEAMKRINALPKEVPF